MKKLSVLSLLSGILISSFLSFAQKDNDNDENSKDPWSSKTFTGLKFRSIGPAYASGRIADFAVNPDDHSEYYVAVACGNVWKTTNSGTTWKPIFDKYGSYSTSSVVIDPNNTNVVWVGTGEYNSQRAIGYGDGVYRSVDRGKSFKNMGLKKSEHIGRILIDPRNSHVYIAAQGPLWGPGGERGLYKTTDEGKTWNKILDISENTGITDIVMDPRNPDILYAASYQRRRHVFTLINGGPESAIYKSTDAGESWRKLTSGIPKVDLGRIGLTISPADPDVIYAIIGAADGKGGFFRSTDRGETWKRMNKYMSTSPQYYNRLIADPKDADKVYSMDTRSKVTEDGGKTFRNLSNKNKHVDDHALWIDPDDTRHLLIGCDGGIYESFDSGNSWLFKPNLPITQYYRVSVDNTLPFYNVYGGTQDNNTMGGPSRTISSIGIVNDDWYITKGGDGFETQIDPEDPNVVYSQSQYGWLIRYDKKSGEKIGIKPMPPSGEAYRWNWNSPLIISPHLHTRLYFAANKLFRSDDRGNTWKVISPDLTRQIDRNTLTVMGRIQSVDAVSKNASTSLYGNIVSLTESPLKEGLIYVGTDDGLIQITENAGENWMKIESFPDVPGMTYVSCLLTSQHDENTVYASFDARKQNNLQPFIFKSTDKGKTWEPIKSNLPERGSVFTIVEDHADPKLLFIGTEFGVFFTTDGGGKWIQLKGGIPTTSVKDLEIQRRENDLVVATFGRSFYILDDYTSLRNLKKDSLDKEFVIFPIKDALMYIQSGAKYNQGSTYYAAKNPPFGATFTWYLKESIKTKKQLRQKAEKKAIKEDQAIKYPTFEELRIEDEEKAPYLLFTIADESGNTVRKLKTSPKAGINRITWDLRYHSPRPVTLSTKPNHQPSGGSLVAPGTYKISVSKWVNGELTQLCEPVEFKVTPLNNTTLPAENREEMLKFQNEVAELGRVVLGTVKAVNELENKLKYIRQALINTSSETTDLIIITDSIASQCKEILVELTGNKSISKRNANQPPSINSRLGTMFYSYSQSTSEPTQTMKDAYKIINEEFTGVYSKLKKLIEVDMKGLEDQMEKQSVPWTPGRLPEWDEGE